MGGGAGGAGARAPVCLRRWKMLSASCARILSLPVGRFVIVNDEERAQRRGIVPTIRQVVLTADATRSPRRRTPVATQKQCTIIHALTCRNEYGLNKSNLCVGMPRRLVQTDCLCDHPRHTTSAPHTSQRHTGSLSCLHGADHITFSTPRGSPTRANRGESQSRSTELEIDGELQFSENSPKRRPRLDRRPSQGGASPPYPRARRCIRRSSRAGSLP